MNSALRSHRGCEDIQQVGAVDIDVCCTEARV